MEQTPKQPLTPSEAHHFRTEKIEAVACSDWFSAAELWDKLEAGCDDRFYHCDQMYGVFSWTGSKIYFGCGEGCCDDEYETKESFVRQYGDAKFLLLGKTW